MENKDMILFDGVCNLCNSSVQFIIKYDKKERYCFASIQSENGQKMLKVQGSKFQNSDSVILIRNGKIYEKSDAALQIVRYLYPFWNILFVFILLPPFIRNKIYDYIAKNRYKWFGKKESCMMPDEKISSRFL